jgi:predicted O-methyltransferase YrrM
MDKIDRVLKRIEKKASESFLPIVGKKKGDFLEKLIRKFRPKRILEIGGLMGYSAIRMARGSSGKIISIEVSREAVNQARKNARDAGLDIEFIRADALNAIPELEGKFDFVFIDASKSEYLKYLRLMEKHDKLCKRTIIVADNVKVFADDMQDYLSYVRKFPSQYFDFGLDGMEISIREKV